MKLGTMPSVIFFTRPTIINPDAMGYKLAMQYVKKCPIFITLIS